MFFPNRFCFLTLRLSSIFFFSGTSSCLSTGFCLPKSQKRNFPQLFRRVLLWFRFCVPTSSAAWNSSGVQWRGGTRGLRRGAHQWARSPACGRYFCQFWWQHCAGRARIIWPRVFYPLCPEVFYAAARHLRVQTSKSSPVKPSEPGASVGASCFKTLNIFLWFRLGFCFCCPSYILYLFSRKASCKLFKIPRVRGGSV